MIKFFRKIRQRLLTENKFSKYLIYAIGEIVLVVIGILIALQINNFNNNRQQMAIEQEYLLSLQAEFTTNLDKINTSIHENDDRVKNVEFLMNLFNREAFSATSESKKYDMLYQLFSGDADYHPSIGVLSDIISSGNLNLIQNKNLRQNLASFESSLDYIQLQADDTKFAKRELKQLHQQFASVRNVMLHKGFSFETVSDTNPENIEELFHNVAFENHLLDYYLTIRATSGKTVFKGIKEKIELILVEIENEIKK